MSTTLPTSDDLAAGSASRSALVTEKCRAGRLTHPELRRLQGFAKTGRAWAPLYGMELRELLPFTVWTAIRLAVAAV